MLGNPVVKRPSLNEYLMDICKVVASRSSCLSPAKGTLIVRDKRIIATGYNATPSGLKHCNEGGCQRCADRQAGLVKSGADYARCNCVHSEENAILQCAKIGISADGCDMYTTHIPPCNLCSKMIINVGIVRVYGAYKFDNTDGQLLHDAGIEVILL